MGLPAVLFDIAFHIVMRATDRIVDAAYGVKTTLENRFDDDQTARTRHGDPEVNMPSYVLRLMALRRFLGPGPDDVFVDLGCGAGRALFVFARAGVRRCRGVEFHAATCSLAATNARSLSGRFAPVDIVRADAASYEFTDETILYLFNPFGRATLRAVLDNLRRSLIARPRRVRIGYYHPLHAELLESVPWLRRVGTVPGFKTDIAVYETRALSRSNLR